MFDSCFPRLMRGQDTNPSMMSTLCSRRDISKNSLCLVRDLSDHGWGEPRVFPWHRNVLKSQDLSVIRKGNSHLTRKGKRIQFKSSFFLQIIPHKNSICVHLFSRSLILTRLSFRLDTTLCQFCFSSQLMYPSLPRTYRSNWTRFNFPVKKYGNETL